MIIGIIGKFLEWLLDPPYVPRKSPDKYDKIGKIHPKSGVRIWPGGRCAAFLFMCGAYPGFKINGCYFHVHVQVAELYIENPENKRVVNHIDGNKLNCHADNLEWMTHSENTKHAYALGLIKSRKSVKNNTDNENNNSRRKFRTQEGD